MYFHRQGWVRIALTVCLALLSLVQQSCGRKEIKPEARTTRWVSRCEVQIQELLQWLDYLMKHNEEAVCGFSYNLKHVVRVDENLPTAKCFRRFVIDEDRFHVPIGYYLSPIGLLFSNL